MKILGFTNYGSDFARAPEWGMKFRRGTFLEGFRVSQGEFQGDPIGALSLNVESYRVFRGSSGLVGFDFIFASSHFAFTGLSRAFEEGWGQSSKTLGSEDPRAGNRQSIVNSRN